MTRLVLFELFVTNLLLFEHQRKTARWLTEFSGPYDVTKYRRQWLKEGCRKPVLGVCRLSFCRSQLVKTGWLPQLTLKFTPATRVS